MIQYHYGSNKSVLEFSWSCVLMLSFVLQITVLMYTVLWDEMVSRSSSFKDRQSSPPFSMHYSPIPKHLRYRKMDLKTATRLPQMHRHRPSSIRGIIHIFDLVHACERAPFRSLSTYLIVVLSAYTPFLKHLWRISCIWPPYGGGTDYVLLRTRPS